MLRLKVLLLAVVLVLAHASALSAQERARIGWAAMTASHVPLWVAQEKGLLVKHGLTPELIFFSAGTTALQALVAGDLDVVLTSAPNVVNPRFGRADTIMIMSIIPTFIDHIIAAPNITSPEQLKGKIGGVNRQGTVSEMGLRLALRRLGVDPEKDTKIVTAGGKPRAAGGDLQRDRSLYDHERAFSEGGRETRLARSGEYRDAENTAAVERRRYPGSHSQSPAADVDSVGARADRGHSLHQS
jgi:ABC-type nitrate/sulfonate/bicarbonate transport system substrate-binding protein